MQSSSEHTLSPDPDAELYPNGNPKTAYITLARFRHPQIINLTSNGTPLASEARRLQLPNACNRTRGKQSNANFHNK